MRGTHSPSRRAWTRCWVVVGVVTVAGLLAAPASATSSQYYNVSVAPGTLQASLDGTTELTVTLRNCPGASPYTPCATRSNSPLGSARVTLTGFTVVSVASLTTPTGRLWNTPAISGSVVSLSAKTGSTSEANKLTPGQVLTLKVNVRTCAVGPHAIGTAAYYTRTFTNGPLASSTFKLSPTGSGPSVSVVPGALAAFDVAAIGSPQTAGDDFDVVATARDACGNLKTNYGGGAVVTGTLEPSPNGTSPSYGAFSNADWSDGVATAEVTAFAAEGDRTVTVTDGAVSKASNAFDVQPGPLDTLAFAQQPTDTKAGETIAPPVTVEGEDAYGNPVSGDAVGIAIGANPSGGTLTGTTLQPLVGGVATFADLEIDKAGLAYTLAASSGSVSATSDPFAVVSEVCTTNGVNCSATTDPTGQGATPTNTTVGSVTVLDTGATEVGDGTIFVALDSPGACPGLSGSSVGSSFVFVPSGFEGAFVKLTVTYDRSVTPNPSWKYKFCMDKEDTPLEPPDYLPDYPNVPLCLVAALGYSDNPLLDALSWLFNYGSWQAALDAYVTANGPCILRRGRTSGLDLEVQFYMTSDDPRVSGFG